MPLPQKQASTTGVSPVVGAILMVAVTVILSATVGMFVLSQQPPEAGDTQSAVQVQETDVGVSVTLVSVESPLEIRQNGESVARFNTSAVGTTYLVPTTRNSTVTIIANPNTSEASVLTKHTTDASSSLTLYYPFETFDGSTVLDQGGLGNDGQMNDALASQESGVNGQAIRMDASGENVTLSTHIGSGTTVSSWVWVKNTSVNQGVYGDEWQWEGGGLQVQNGNFVTMASTGDDAFRWSVGVSPASQRWYHVVQVYDSDGTRTYVNGSLVSEREYVAATGGAMDFKLGKSSQGGFEHSHFNGRLDDFRVYSTALTSNEVQSLYNASK